MTRDIESERLFLREYEALTRKYNLIVNSCGCCFSPWVTAPDAGQSVEKHIKHLREEMERDVK